MIVPVPSSVYGWVTEPSRLSWLVFLDCAPEFLTRVKLLNLGIVHGSISFQINVAPLFQTTSYKNLFHTWQNSENMKTSLCIVLSPARASPLDYFQHLLVSHTLIHTHVFCYHEADISLVERNVSTTIRQIAQLWICEFRICGITLSPSCCVFSSR